jgi:uncharacterized membrane protein
MTQPLAPIRARGASRARWESVSWLAWAVGGLTLLAAGLRFSTLGEQSYWYNEAATVVVMKASFGDMISRVSHVEGNPPLYYVLAWVWSKAFGTGDVALRTLSAILGTLTVPAAFLAGRELASRRAGLVAAALVALNPFLVWYSQEARSYALLVLLLTLGLYLFARARRDPTPRNLGLWALASALALSSHYFAAFVVVPEGVWLLAATRPRIPVLAAVASVGAAGLALLPLAMAQQSGRRTDPFAGAGLAHRCWQTLVHFASSLKPPLFAGGNVGILQIGVGIAEAALAVAATAILWRFGARSERRGALVALSVGATAFAIPIVLALSGIDFVNERNMIGSLTPLLVAAGIAFGCAGSGRVGLAAAGVACCAFAVVLIAVNVTSKMQRPDWRDAAKAIEAGPAGRVVVVPALAQIPISYYLGAERSRVGRPPIRVRRLEILGKRGSLAPPEPGFKRVSQHRTVAGRLWLRRYAARRPQSIGSSLVPSSNLIVRSPGGWRYPPPPRLTRPL